MEENNGEQKTVWEVKRPEIPRETQIAMMNFFLKTSVPRILKQISEENDFNMKGKENDK